MPQPIVNLLILLVMLMPMASDAAPTAADKQQFLHAVITEIYQPAIAQLRQDHAVLAGLLDSSCGTDDLVDVNELQQAWTEVYQQWKRVESYTFGPVSYNHLSRQIGFWPTRDKFLQMLVLGEGPVDRDRVYGLSIATKGYPALEWVFFTRFATDLPALEQQRYCQLSQWLTVEIQEELAVVEEGYQLAEFLQVLNGERELTLAESAFSYEPFAEWLNTVIATQYELRKLYLIKPAGLRPATRVLPESVDAYHSGQSQLALRARWQALKTIYLGDAGGPALTHLLAHSQTEAGNDAEAGMETVAEQLRQAVAAVDRQLLQLPAVDLSTLVLEHHPLLVELDASLFQLETLLLTQVTAALDTPSLFVNNDGD